MSSFLITFKPATENAKQGWPLAELQRVVARVNASGSAVEPWRFHNRKEAHIGDRAFLLLQGKQGPAIIGYGRVAGTAERRQGQWQTPVRFERLVDPSRNVLANRSDLPNAAGAEKLWRTQSSGVRIPNSVADALEHSVVGRVAKPISTGSETNPDWTRDELIVALDVYLRHRTSPPGKDSNEILDLSETLQRLGQKLFPSESRGVTFRNPNGVYMKLMNFRRLDPSYTSEGKKGLARGAKGEVDVWNEYASDAAHCYEVAIAIRAGIDDAEADAENVTVYGDPDFQEAPEGRLLTREHISRERNRKLIEKKREDVLKREGRLTCEACGFDFGVRYGERGEGFIECHHLKPVSSLMDGDKTNLRDLALVCSNCHRVIHRRRPWLSLDELKNLLR